MFNPIIDMKFSLVFDNSGDTLPFDVVYNQELFEFFVEKANAAGQNSFSNHQFLSKQIDPKLTHLHWALSKTNEVLYDLIKKSFAQQDTLTNYLDQDFLNKTHCEWVHSQKCTVDIDVLRHSIVASQAKIGNILHDMYPDEIRQVKIAPVLEKLGYIYPYEEVNMSVHRLESVFNKSNLEFRADQKWDIFDNPFVKTMVSNNNVVNFSFGYTYVGRQYYNKFEHFDTSLQYDDHYNYETLEFAFQLNLAKPQTIPYSSEFVEWANEHNIKPTTTQLPIANLADIDNNLFEYRKILYRNSRDNNRAKIFLH
jgi:hypothetical protein